MLALIDCNNFFVSCERIFNPKLVRQPVIVTSHNNGCILARSQEAKRLGLPMGAPVFKYKNIIDQNNVVMTSCNFTLYGDISRRVFDTVKSFGFETEVYSVDEAFVDIGEDDCIAIAYSIKSRIKKWVGIDVSIGLGDTKTLSKLASELAKKNIGKETPLPGVFLLTPTSEELRDKPIEDVWGIGLQSAQKLKSHGIKTVASFQKMPDASVRKLLSLEGLKTKNELLGVRCIFHHQSDKSMSLTRTLSKESESREYIHSLLAQFVVKLLTKLRKKKRVSSHISCMCQGNRFVKRVSFYDFRNCIEPSDYTPYFLSLLDDMMTDFSCDFPVKRIGITLSSIYSKDEYQPSFLYQEESPLLMKTVDSIKEKFGAHTVFYGREGTNKEYIKSGKNISPRYTSVWSDIITIKDEK